VIDPAGRWVSIASVTNGSTTTYSALRLNTNGTPDTTLGAGGLKALTLPSTVTLGGVSRPVTFRLSGMITTTDEVFFAGYIGYGTYPQNCNQPGSYSTMTRPFIVSLKSAGLVTTFGSSGIGQEYTVTGTTTSCGAFPTSLNTFISKTGAHFGLAYGTSSMKTVTWQPVPGVTGGGEGGTGTGGATNDTGGKPFTGASNGLSRADTTVYKKLPTSTGEDFAFRALSAAEAKTAELVSLTPKVCITFNRSVLTVNPGKCRVEVRDKATDEVLRKLTTIVEEDGSSDEGSTADSIDPILFTEASAKLSKAARAQLKEIVEATESAGTILVVGHSASLTENSPSNWLISLNRARAVRAAMIKAGVKAPIQVLALGSKAPVETKKTEKAQSQNRRVEIFILPAASPAA
jgi:outer membrane protein OmpA-like peptidoglycan-associated protein